MIEEIKTDNNCIVKAFENNPIAILQECSDNKKVYYFKASDIGKALEIVNIHSTVQNFDEDERVIRTAYDTKNRVQDTTFLSSQGVYRLLYNSKKDIAKKFRKWAGNILDDIIFNESSELKKQLEQKEREIKQITQDSKLNKQNILLREFNKTCNLVYIIKVKTIENNYVIKLGESRCGISGRYKEHKKNYPECVLLDCFEVKRSKDFEKLLHSQLRHQRYTSLSGHEKENELFLVGQELSYQMVLNLIQNNIQSYQDDQIHVNILQMEIEKLKLENENLKLHQNTVSKELSEMNKRFDTLKKMMQKLLDQNCETNTTNNFGERLATIGPKVQCINPETMNVVKVYTCVAEIEKSMNLPRSSVVKAIEENTVYSTYRWNYEHETPRPTVDLKKQTPVLDYIVKLNQNKTEIINIYLDRKTASLQNGHTSCARLDAYVKNGISLGGYYYCLLQNVSQELIQDFKNKLNIREIVLSKEIIGKYDLQNELVKEYRSKNDLLKNSEIGNKSLTKALFSGSPYKSFYYKNLGSRTLI